jgi:Amt family ammonium transporter
MGGYRWAFGSPSLGGLVGGSWSMPDGRLPSEYAGVPVAAHVVFQLSFAAVAAALVYDGGAWRGRVSSWTLAMWSLLVYSPVAHWVWNHDGWLLRLGALDFAGGTVVHVVAGASVFGLALASGPPRGIREERGPGLGTRERMLVGTGLLWVGWLGFNGGSALAANANAATAVLNSQVAMAAGAVGWVQVRGLLLGRPGGDGSVVMDYCAGAIAGLVAITPAAGLTTPLWATLVGGGVSVACCLAQRALRDLIDDPMDVVAVHGVGGLLGALATGAVVVDGASLSQVVVQGLAACSAALYAFLMSWWLGVAARRMDW